MRRQMTLAFGLLAAVLPACGLWNEESEGCDKECDVFERLDAETCECKLDHHCRSAAGSPISCDDDDDDNCTLTCSPPSYLNPGACRCELDEDDCRVAKGAIPSPMCLPVDDDDDICSFPVDDSATVGKAFVFTGDGATISESCASPPTNPLICTQMPAMMSEDSAAFRLALYVEGQAGNVMTLMAAFLDDSQQQDGAAIAMPPVDFSGNPCFSAWLENFEIIMGDLSLNVVELAIEGAFSSDPDRIDLMVFRLALDATTLSEQVGIDVCSLGICLSWDGTLLLELHNVTAPHAPGVMIVLDGM